MLEPAGGGGVRRAAVGCRQLSSLLHAPVRRCRRQLRVGFGRGDIREWSHRIEREGAIGEGSGQVRKRLELRRGSYPQAGGSTANPTPFRYPRHHRYGSIPAPRLACIEFGDSSEQCPLNSGELAPTLFDELSELP